MPRICTCEQSAPKGEGLLKVLARRGPNLLRAHELEEAPSPGQVSRRHELVSLGYGPYRSGDTRRGQIMGTVFMENRMVLVSEGGNASLAGEKEKKCRGIGMG